MKLSRKHIKQLILEEIYSIKTQQRHTSRQRLDESLIGGGLMLAAIGTSALAYYLDYQYDEYLKSIGISGFDKMTGETLYLDDASQGLEQELESLGSMITSGEMSPEQAVKDALNKDSRLAGNVRNDNNIDFGNISPEDYDEEGGTTGGYVLGSLEDPDAWEAAFEKSPGE